MPRGVATAPRPLTTYEPDPNRILSLNCHGLNIPERRTQLLRDLYARRISIAFLQETHFKEGAAPMLKSKHYPNAACSNHPTARRAGVAILLEAKQQFCEADRLSDANGRYLFLKGDIQDRRYTFARIYVPNNNQAQYIRKSLLKLSSFTEGTLILGGDFHVPLHPLTDLSTGHSCITEAEIAAAHWSDHGPVTLKIDSPRMRPTSWAWRLQDSLLLDLTVREQVSEELNSYFMLNATRDHVATTIWEAHKSVIRGTLMHLASKKRKESQRQITDLVDCISTLEAQHNRSHLESTYAELLEARRQLQKHMMTHHYRSLQRSKAFFYQHANKGGRLLARILKGPQGLAQVNRLRQADDTITQFPDKIASEFRTFYSSLYNIPQPTQPNEIVDRNEKMRNYIKTYGNRRTWSDQSS
ncbi:Hypothetical predicted protein [Pelobates cultripes]|uniref:exodeoxyribonuclease III n=1 Tax=Pelobates cultripes TaxID=61616 RepID=A0AAD1WN46_PELCU|nr:Hypothetical predicted protein [Pelobates cultripes]